MYKKNKFVIFSISILLIFNSTISLASLEDALKGHWAEKLVDKKFFNEYFSYLSEADYKNFSPNMAISRKNFYHSLSSLIKRYNNKNEEIIGNANDEKSENENITRKEVASLLVKSLEICKGNKEIYDLTNPFTDLDNIEKEYKIDILKGYKLGLIKGYSNKTFKPNNEVSQIEAVLLLQRLEGELSMDKSNIPFKVIDNKKVYTQINRKISVKNNDDKIIVTIYEKLPNPGYNVAVEKIIRSKEGKYDIYIEVESSNKYEMNLQVITFNVLSIEIDKKYIADDSYSFNVIGGLNNQNNKDGLVDM
ncbi:hypothetical protein Y919_03135 [Caloranaerobacter azorensis H53214]|uniref:SLH domain-containing protein n=1 Tax=Caloranaerobacter azorensis H53214 TaxID=1156417 RepID=A0A096BIG1_9FIRM|nr:S-layer homology domain-containing protein [Caloranaerobacter azorensis]KGG80980.1 hypothetical protein Y919_03135 [Caloranaerobacter azorensis H53214]